MAGDDRSSGAARSSSGLRRKRVSILGATGSVGQNTVALIGEDRDRYEVVALTANRNVDRLAQQAQKLRPRLAVVADPSKYLALKNHLAGTGIAVAAGPEAVVEAAALPSDWVMGAIVGAAGLEPVLAAIATGTTVALANKECLVCAGPLIMAAVQEHRATLVPVDSEHSAIFQVFDFDAPETVEKIILTASGGPFLRASREAMAAATPEQAVAHPNWDMGAKISVDSATMMNKGLELIEACRLFPVPAERIDVVVHPQSIVHSLVSYVDGSVLAQLGSPDMRTPIAVALGWPGRISAGVKRLDLASVGRLDFLPPDDARFPALRLAREALASGPGGPAVLNAANEIAVGQFLARRIGFLDIVRVVEETLGRVAHGRLDSLAELRVLDGSARETALYLSRGVAVAQ
ncbi:MAG: 1-deoxy-D-xylulose-5-phosphate reductoisomerase [Alphaproteobacteria bacterium]